MWCKDPIRFNQSIPFHWESGKPLSLSEYVDVFVQQPAAVQLKESKQNYPQKG